MANRHPGMGQDYEALLPAYLSLKLYKNSEIEDFCMQSNNKKFGDFDDLIVNIKQKNQEWKNFAIQLKHAENDKRNVIPTSFKNSNNFNLSKYAETVKHIDNYYFILYTNKNFDQSRVREIEDWEINLHQTCPGSAFFDTSLDNSIYKLYTQSASSLAEFFDKFSFYSNQKSLHTVKENIENFFKDKEPSNYRTLADSYVGFFRRWHNREFASAEIKREDVTLFLIDLYISAAIITPMEESRGWNDKFQCMEEALKKFNLVTVDHHFQIENWKCRRNIPIELCIEHGKRYKMLTRSDKDLTFAQKNKILGYAGLRPLLIKFDQHHRNLIEHGLRVLSEEGNRNKMTLVLITTTNDDNSGFYFRNLLDLKPVDEKLFNELLKMLRVGFGKERSFSLEEIFDKTPELAKSVSINDLLLMCGDNFIIKQRETEKLPDHYIPRTVKKPIFNSTISKCVNDKFIISCSGLIDEVHKLFEGISEKISCGIVDEVCNIIRDDRVQNRQIILLGMLPKNDEFLRMTSFFRKFNVHLLKAIDTDKFEWLTTKGKRDNLRNLEITSNLISESDLKPYQNINLVCALPGMGKTTMLKKLMNRFNDQYWIVKLDLLEHANYFERQQLDVYHFLKKEENISIYNNSIREILIKERRVCFFIDGVDEVKSNLVPKIVKFMQLICKEGFHVWASSRDHLQEILETDLDTFAIDIQEIGEQDQKDYIKKQLIRSYDQGQINDIISTIQTHSIGLNTPLQLYILADSLKNVRSMNNEISQGMFVLTKMFYNFYVGRWNHYAEKTKRRVETYQADGSLDEYFERYQIFALDSILSEEAFASLNISDIYRKQLSQTRAIDDALGIVHFKNEHKVIFMHESFCEYFAAVYLCKHMAEIDKLEQILFTNDNLRMMFDVKLAENCPAHLAVLYGDLERLQQNSENINNTDDGGRNLLHLACSHGQKYPLLLKRKSCEKHLVFGRSKYKIAKELPNRVKILKYLLTTSIDIYQKDEIFKWNAVTYADKSLNSFALEIILRAEKQTNHEQDFLTSLQNFCSVTTLLYYSVEFGYINLLKTTYKLYQYKLRNSNRVCQYFNNIYSPFGYSYPYLLNMENDNGESLLHIAVLHEHLQCVKLLLNSGVYITTFNKINQTPLHIAVIKNNADIVKLLVENGARCDLVDINGKSSLHEAIRRGHLESTQILLQENACLKSVKDPLHLAVRNGHINIVKYLIDYAKADINGFDKNGYTPLHCAVIFRKNSLVAHLANIGADQNLNRKLCGNSPLHFAAEFGNQFAVETLSNAVINSVNLLGQIPLHLAAIKGHSKIVEILLQKDSDKNIGDKVKLRTPLHYAISNNHPKIVSILLNDNDDPNIVDINGNNALHLSVMGEMTAIFDSILNKIGDINHVNKLGRTALHMASEKRDLYKCTRLLEYSTDPTIGDLVGGYTALHLAVKSGYAPVCKLLLKKCRNLVNIKDKSGKSCFYYAVNMHYIEIVRLLAEFEADISNFRLTLLC